jgi:hypothetical protein
MSDFAHGVRAAHRAYEMVEKTPSGHCMTAVVITGTVAAARVIGGAAAAAAVAAAAPIVVPLIIIGGLGYLISQSGKKQ